MSPAGLLSVESRRSRMFDACYHTSVMQVVCKWYASGNSFTIRHDKIYQSDSQSHDSPKNNPRLGDWVFSKYELLLGKHAVVLVDSGVRVV